MTAAQETAPLAPPRRRLPLTLIGGWELGIVIFMLVLYVVAAWINPRFFGSGDALGSVLRDAARYGVMAVGISFVIINKDLDLSVGSIYGLAATVFSVCYSGAHYDGSLAFALGMSLVVGLFVGVINGALVTILKVPAFISTLTVLFIGRGFVTGLSGGKTITFLQKANGDPLFFAIGQANGFGFNNQILVFLVFVAIGAVVLARTRMGYETFATGGNELAASYAGIPTNWVRMRAYILSAFCATIAGLMAVAQDRGIGAASGQGLELVVIASVIVGGASILGGRGRIIGAGLGAILIVLIDKVLREGFPITRIQLINGKEVEMKAVAQLPPGAVPAFLGLILLLAVLMEPYVIRRKLPQRLWARLRGLPPPPAPDTGGVAIQGAQTHGARATARAMSARGLAAFFYRRDAAALMLMVLLWIVGLILRPDFWGSIDNSFNLLLAFSEVALLCVGLTYVIANGDIDLSVGSVLALSGSVAGFCMSKLGFDPSAAILIALLAGMSMGALNGLLVTRFKLPAFVATLGTFYMARGISVWLVAGGQLSNFPAGFNLLGRKLIELLRYMKMEPGPGLIYDIAAALSVQTIVMSIIALIAGIVLAYTTIGQRVYATGGNTRAADYAGINTNAIRFWSLVFSSFCAAVAGVLYIAFFRAFNPSAGLLRELDGIAAVIIGGGSIFGGFGTVIGSLAGAAVIALVRALLSLQIITAEGSFVMPQHWVNVFIGLILLIAVVADIWIRQFGIIGTIADILGWRRKEKAHV
ncbi:MAG TPA: ABC transporter permease [Devosia sp.]|nr:ABC transporter permease [Devosia sp.]